MARYLMLLLFFLALSSLHTTTSSSTLKGFSLELIDRDSIHSPLYPGNLTTPELIRRQVKLHHAHLQRLKLSIAHGMSISPAVSHEDKKYIVRLGIGTPQTGLHLLLDTGSDPVWTQCHPCRQCFPQVLPAFRPDSSHTYHPLSCRHPLCMPQICDNRGICEFMIRFQSDDGHYTKGTMATEDFTSRLSNGGSTIIKDIIFGCSVESSKDFFRRTDKIAGILGMGRGPQSIVTQLGNSIQHRFSYCLLPYNHKGFTFLRFGNDVKVGRGAQSTPFVPHPIPLFYFLNLMDISVNDARLHFPPGAFAIHPDGTGGCLVDTGAPYTVLIGPAYEVVAHVVVNHFATYNLTMISGEDYELGLCYRMPRGFQDFPSMTFHFQNADLLLGTQHLFMIDHWKSAFCLMMVPAPDLSILGAAQMVNMQFIYDVEAKQLTFAPHDCTLS